MAAVEKWQPQPLERMTVEQIRYIASSDIVPSHLRGKPQQIIAAIIKGRALGLDDMHALEAMHFINGKACMTTQTMSLLARRAGHSISGEVTETSATVKGKRADTGDTMSVTFTMEDAKRADLAGKDVWKKYPQSMLMARATSQLCRWLFPDVLAGAAYTPEGLELSPEDQVAHDIGMVGPPDDDEGPDDTTEAEVVEAPAVPADVPQMDAGGQTSVFADMAEKAQGTRRRSKPADEDNA